MKPNFELCANLSTELLYNQNTFKTKIDVTELKYDKNIIFDSIQEYARITNRDLKEFMSNGVLKGGCCIYHKCSDTYIVLYNSECNSKEHINWTLAHEIGHIYLGHTKDGDIEEIEAHYFAAQLLMPEHSLNYIRDRKKILTKEDICKLYFVSGYAAEKRIAAMAKKKQIRSGHYDKSIFYRTKLHIDRTLFGYNDMPDILFRFRTDFVNYMSK